MRRKIFRRGIFLVPLLALTVAGAAASGLVETSNDRITGSWEKRGLEIPDEDTQYLGYGYNILAGKAISDPDALLLANPILDVNNPGLLSMAKAYSASQTTYLSHTTSSTRELAEKYGTTLGGGIQGKVYELSVNIGTKFNTSSSFSEKAQEEYSYYSIYAKNRTVLLQASASMITEYLSDRFKEDVLSIFTETDAAKIFARYGTHLVTGYNLGGIFEMTNYYASRSSSYQRQNSLDFTSQVAVALGSYGAGASFSFTNEFGINDNNSYAVNNYKCTTYGGHVFPGLTINQAFQWYTTAFSAGYVYDIWTESINNGENLAIVSIPQSSELLPIWSLLPSDAAYDEPKAKLIAAYIKEAGISYADFLARYPDVNHNRRPIKVPASEVGYLGNGVEIYAPSRDASKPNKKFYSYVPQDEVGTVIRAFPGTTLAFDYEPALYVGRELEWSIEPNDPDVQILDTRNGVFQIRNGEIAESKDLIINLTLDGDPIYSVDLKVLGESGFAGGQGTESAPYLIANVDDLMQFLYDVERYKNDCFLLEEDISLEGYDPSIQVGSYNGIFDGNLHTISGLRLAKENAANEDESSFRKGFGLFGYLSGEVRNLNVVYNKDISGNFTNHTYEETAAAINTELEVEDYATKVMDVYHSYGGLVGINDGVIDNCNVSGLRMEIMSSLDQDWLNIGPLVGFNRGTVRDCTAQNCQTDIHGRAKFGDGATNVAVGGLIGRHGVTAKKADGGKDAVLSGSGSIACSSSFKGYGVSTNKSHSLSVGGLVGHMGFLRPDSNSIRDVSGFTECLVKGYVTTGTFTDNAHIGPTMVFGGFVGLLDNFYTKPSFARSVVYGVDTSSSVKVHDNAMAGTRNAILIAGFHDADSINNAFVTEDIVYDTRGTMHLCNDRDDKSDGLIASGCAGVIQVDGAVWNNLPDSIRNAARFTNDGGQPSLVRSTAETSDVRFDFTDAKKRFYVGDEFSAGTIKATYETSDGTESSTVSLSIDASSFTSAYPTTCIIRVYAMGASASYTVMVVEPSVIGIEFDDENWVGKDFTYYAGDVISTAGLKVKEVTENLAGGADITDKVRFPNADEPLVEGLNLIEATYTDSHTGKEYSTTYPLIAERSTIVGLSFDEESMAPAQLKMPVGATKMDARILVGARLTASVKQQTVDGRDPSYDLIFSSEKVRNGKVTIKPHQTASEKACEYDIPIDEVEFYFSPIRAAADNKVTVCFGGYLTDESVQASFMVEGVQSEASLNEDAFVDAVNAIKFDATPLADLHVSICKAVALRKAVVDGGVSDAYAIASQMLDQYIAQYNELVNGINGSFYQSITIPTRLQLNTLMKHGMYVLPALLYLAFLVL